MTEIVRQHEDLNGTVRSIQNMVVNRLRSGCTSFGCVSRDGRYMYSLTPARETVEQLEELPFEDIIGIQEWNLIRSEKELVDRSMRMVRYNIYKNEDDDLALAVTLHLFPVDEGDIEELSTTINDASRLQHQVGLTLPEMRDFADVDNAIQDYVHQNRFLRLLQQLESVMPFTRLDLINPN